MERLIHLLLISALCPFTKGSPREYVLIEEQKTWDKAQAYCRQTYIDLATVQTNEDFTNLQTALKPALSLVWTGLFNDINSWRWSYKDEALTYEHYYTSDPSNSNGRQECVGIYYGDWNDLPCTFMLYCFCYDETQTGAKRFIYISDMLRTWLEAQSYCRQHYTDLAIIRNSVENAMVNIPSSDYIWIGLYRDSWKWSDGTNVTTYPIKWITGEPDRTGLSPPCGAARSDGLLNDKLCSRPYPFVCMLNPKKQIVKVEVKSGQNLNDPKMKLIILQWIQRKLLGTGIADMTWRVQPDGNVFSPKPEKINPSLKGC